LTFHVNEKVCAAMFPEKLSTSPAWCDWFVVSDTADGDNVSATAHVQYAKYGALGTQCEPI
jgi:hypothetical protein